MGPFSIYRTRRCTCTAVSHWRKQYLSTYRRRVLVAILSISNPRRWKCGHVLWILNQIDVWISFYEYDINYIQIGHPKLYMPSLFMCAIQSPSYVKKWLDSGSICYIRIYILTVVFTPYGSPLTQQYHFNRKINALFDKDLEILRLFGWHSSHQHCKSHDKISLLQNMYYHVFQHTYSCKPFD